MERSGSRHGSGAPAGRYCRTGSRRPREASAAGTTLGARISAMSWTTTPSPRPPESATPSRIIDQAERARRGDRLGAGLERLARSLGVDARAALLLHPHPAAAGAAAERLLAALLHLAQLDPGHGAEHVARLAIDAVVARQVARVVERDASARRRRSTRSRPSSTQAATGTASGARRRTCRRAAQYSLPIVLKQCGQAVMIVFGL